MNELTNKQRILEIYAKIKEERKKDPEYQKAQREIVINRRPTQFDRHTGISDKQDKPPKLKFKPGTFLENKKGELFEILYCYRVRDKPHEWLFCLEDRSGLINPKTPLSTLCSMLSPETRGRIEYRLFRSSMDASSEIGSNIYAHGDRVCVSNKTLLNDYKVVSSGGLE